jgi:hypothetical protein
MFSTLLGPLPAEPAATAASSTASADAAGRDQAEDVTALEAAGLELLTDGGPPADLDDDPAAVVARWRAAAEATSVPVKQALAGPYTAGRAAGIEPEAAAERIRPALLALAGAGCPFVEIVETGAGPIASDPAAAAAFGRAHRRLVDGSEGVHASLSIIGGDVDGADPATLFDLAYASFAFDLIAGPDNWRLIARAPADRGIICGALGFAPGSDETREVLVWAAHYAASTNGRGLARVGLANAPTTGPITRADALRKLAIVAEASRIAAVETDELARHLDPRAIGPRSSAPPRFAPARRRRA